MQGQDDVQMFPVIPRCQTTVYADPGTTGTLNYPVPISGMMKGITIFIQRRIDDSEQGD